MNRLRRAFVACRTFILLLLMLFSLFFFNDTATTEIYTLSLHDALPIYLAHDAGDVDRCAVESTLGDEDLPAGTRFELGDRSEEHTSELQSHSDLVCRLLLEKKKRKKTKNTRYTNRINL